MGLSQTGYMNHLRRSWYLFRDQRRAHPFRLRLGHLIIQTPVPSIGTVPVVQLIWLLGFLVNPGAAIEARTSAETSRAGYTF